MANSMHNFNTKHSKKSFAATNVESFIMLWKWMLLNRWDHPSLWNGLRTSFWIGWDHSFDGMKPPIWIGWDHPFEMDEDILWNGCGHPCEMRISLWNGWEHPSEWKKNFSSWKFIPVVFRWNIHELAEDGWMDGWMGLSLIYVFWLLTPSITFTFFGVHKKKFKNLKEN